MKRARTSRFASKKTLSALLILALAFAVVGGCAEESTHSTNTGSSTSTSSEASSDSAQDSANSQDSTNDNSTSASSAHSDNEETTASSSSQNAGAASLPSTASNALSLASIPDYSGSPYVYINNGDPTFTDAELATSFGTEKYGELDSLGRCTYAFAIVGPETQPTTKRGNIGDVKPTGWRVSKYDFVDGKYLFNRCHLLGWQLTAEDANWCNLITGTRYMNVDGMLPFEDIVDTYVDATGNHVAMVVTPLFSGDDLIARGVHMMAQSIEDEGEGVSFNVFCYNVQPGVTINYATGENEELSDATSLPSVNGS
jgi:DNA-entry nuclease